MFLLLRGTATRDLPMKLKHDHADCWNSNMEFKFLPVWGCALCECHCIGNYSLLSLIQVITKVISKDFISWAYTLWNSSNSILSILLSWLSFWVLGCTSWNMYYHNANICFPLSLVTVSSWSVMLFQWINFNYWVCSLASLLNLWFAVW